MFRKQKATLLLAGIFLAGNFVAWAQDPVKLSREEAVKMALKYNTDILNSEIDMQMAKKKIWETTASGLPHGEVKSAYSFYPKVPTLPASFFDPNAPEGATIELGVKQNVVTDITISQLIFSGSYIVGLQASKVYFGMSKQNAEKTRLEVVETVRNTYNMIQLAEESKKILAQNLENINKTLYEISEMHKEGFLEKTDVDQLELTGNTVRNAINQVNTNLELSYRLLKIQMGMDESSKVELIDQVENDEALTRSSMTLIAEPFTIERNVDYQMIQTNEKAAKLQLKLAQSAYLPTISGYYNHTEKLKSPAFDFAPKDMLGINFSLPIFSSGEKMAVVSQRKMDLEKAQNTTKYVSSSIRMQATQYQSDLKLKLEKYQIQLKSKQLSDDIYQRTLEKYKQGVASSMDLMNSQSQYLTNLTNYYQAIYDLESAKSKLEKLYNLNQEPK
jgi:outer membrane protein TolC